MKLQSIANIVAPKDPFEKLPSFFKLNDSKEFENWCKSFLWLRVDCHLYYEREVNHV